MIPSVVEFDSIMNGSFSKYMSLSADIGGDVDTQAQLVKKCFESIREIILTAASSQVPTDAGFQDLIKPCSAAIAAVIDFKDKNRTSKDFNHLSAIAESIPALGWITVKPTPGPHVKDMAEAGQFYSNRVLKEYKEKDQKHVDWCKTWASIWTDMQAYIKTFHTTGLTWNPKGQPSSGKASAARVPGAPPPPPPPPPMETNGATGGDDAAARADLFKALNKGSDITTGLRKVTDDMKTHKNPGLRAGSTVSDTALKTAGPVFAGAKEAKKPPCKELRGNKWCVENYENDSNIEVVADEIKQTVYIYKCTNSTVKITGKVNSIVLDSCKKVGLIFESIISCLDLVNCQSVQAQVTQDLPAVNIDKTDGAQIYLSEKSKQAEIVTAKSSSVNITIPSDDGDFVEHPIPEQLKSKFDGKKMITSVNESL